MKQKIPCLIYDPETMQFTKFEEELNEAGSKLLEAMIKFDQKFGSEAKHLYWYRDVFNTSFVYLGKKDPRINYGLKIEGRTPNIYKEDDPTADALALDFCWLINNSEIEKNFLLQYRKDKRPSYGQFGSIYSAVSSLSERRQECMDLTVTGDWEGNLILFPCGFKIRSSDNPPLRIGPNNMPIYTSDLLKAYALFINNAEEPSKK